MHRKQILFDRSKRLSLDRKDFLRIDKMIGLLDTIDRSISRWIDSYQQIDWSTDYYNCLI